MDPVALAARGESVWHRLGLAALGVDWVERDAVALWWYNRAPRPAFDLDTFADPWMTEFREVYAGLGRDLHVLDLTNDLGVPAAAAVSRRLDAPSEDILMAFGAHFDVRIAVQRALAELNQFIPAVIDIGPDGVTRYRFPEKDQVDWWTHARVADHPYLVPAGSPVPASATRGCRSTRRPSATACGSWRRCSAPTWPTRPSAWNCTWSSTPG